MSSIFVSVHALVLRLARRARDCRGQSTSEYALVLLGAATLALLVVAWAAKTDRVTRLLDAVFDIVISKVA